MFSTRRPKRRESEAVPKKKKCVRIKRYVVPVVVVVVVCLFAWASVLVLVVRERRSLTD